MPTVTVAVVNTPRRRQHTAAASAGAVVRWGWVACLAVFVAAFWLTVGPTSGIVLSEIFPGPIRGRATSFLTVERRREAAADWQAIESAIRAGDGDGAEKAARRLFAHSAAAVRAELQAKPRQP